ncbi:MAG TPA: hypothetical protein QGH10_14540, partial [Armatimonadota bacterium]|nr:hypothetical protein [Armatimonadota bacterium]
GIASTYDVMEAMEPFVAGGEVPGEVLVCYSRRSEDTWDRMARAEEVEGSKRGFKAHRNVIYALLRRGIPFRMTFLEHPDPARLDEAKVLLVPFAYALNEDEVALLEEQAGAGKTVIVMSEVPTGLDERDGVIFLGEDSATGLLEPFAPKGERGVKVALPPLEADHVAALEAEIDQALERKSSLFAEPVAEDVEVTLLESPSARVLLAVNWETESSTTVALDVPVRNGKARGQRILPDGTVEAVETRVSKGQIELELQPQEAVILALEK